MVSAAAIPQWRYPAVDTRPEDSGCAGGSGAQTCASSIRGVGRPEAGRIERFHKTALELLWTAGMAQEYRLFDWIDYRNFQIHYEIEELRPNLPPRAVEPSKMFPGSTRSVLLQSYLLGVTWAFVPKDRLEMLKESLSTRFAQRYCREHRPRGTVVVHSLLQRIDPYRSDGGAGDRRVLMRFGCDEGQPQMTQRTTSTEK
jgi:hypothetical protein